MTTIISPTGAPIGVTTLDGYQEAAGKYQLPQARPEERVFGLLEEAGEVAGVFKRMFRGDYDEPTAMAKLHKEIGDCLWYLSRIAADNDWTLSDVANGNLEKLESRYQRNKLQGKGDER